MSGPEKLEDVLGAVRYFGRSDSVRELQREFFEQRNRLYKEFVDSGWPSRKVFLDELAKDAYEPSFIGKIRDFEQEPEPAPRLSIDDAKKVIQKAMQEVARANRNMVPDLKICWESEPEYRARRRRRLLLLV